MTHTDMELCHTGGPALDGTPAPRAAASRRPDGFTLIEVIVAAAIFALVSGLSVVTFQAAINSRNTATSRVEIFEKGRGILQLMSEDLATAYLSPESITRESDNTTGTSLAVTNGPKFAVYSLEAPALFDGGVDNDGDGRTDEDPIDGIDNDNDGLIDEDPGYSRRDQFGIDNDNDGSTDEDPLNGIDDDGDGLIDEDYAVYPRDLILFASTQVNPGIYDLTQVGYTLGFSLSPSTNNATAGVPELRRMYVSTADTGAELTFPIAQLGNETPYIVDRMLGVNGISGFTEDQTVAFEVIGFDVNCWYYNYNPLFSGWEQVPYWNSTEENYFNEKEDIPNNFDPEQALRHTDGLPSAVDITLYLVDEKGREYPRQISTRVFLSQSALTTEIHP